MSSTEDEEVNYGSDEDAEDSPPNANFSSFGSENEAAAAYEAGLNRSKPLKAKLSSGGEGHKLKKKTSKGRSKGTESEDVKDVPPKLTKSKRPKNPGKEGEFDFALSNLEEEAPTSSPESGAEKVKGKGRAVSSEDEEKKPKKKSGKVLQSKKVSKASSSGSESSSSEEEEEKKKPKKTKKLPKKAASSSSESESSSSEEEEKPKKTSKASSSESESSSSEEEEKKKPTKKSPKKAASSSSESESSDSDGGLTFKLKERPSPKKAKNAKGVKKSGRKFTFLLDSDQEEESDDKKSSTKRRKKPRKGRKSAYPQGGMTGWPKAKESEITTFSADRPAMWRKINLTPKAKPFSVKSTESILRVSIREGLVDDAIKAAFELYRLEEVLGYADMAKYLFWPLIFAAAEDISVADPELAGLAIHNCHKWLDESKAPTLVTVLELVWKMTLAPKTRICEYLFNFYRNPANGSTRATKKEEKQLRDPNEPAIDDFFLDGDDKKLVGYGAVFYLRLKARDPSCLIFLYMYLMRANASSPKASFTPRKGITIRQAEIVIEKMLLSLYGQKVPIVSAAMSAYYSAKSRVMNEGSGNFAPRKALIYFAVLCYLFKLPLGGVVPKMGISAKDPIHAEVQAIIDRLYTGNYDLVVRPETTLPFIGWHGRGYKFDESLYTKLVNEDMRYHLPKRG